MAVCCSCMIKRFESMLPLPVWSTGPASMSSYLIFMLPGSHRMASSLRLQRYTFLFCCVEVSSVVLCCVALCCNPLCCVALCCVVLRSVVLCLFCCVVLHCCDPLCRCCVVSAELRCVVLHWDPSHNTCCVALCCVVLLTSSAFLVFHLC